MNCNPVQVIKNLSLVRDGGHCLPLPVVVSITGLSRARVRFLVETGVFQSHRRSGYLLIYTASVERWCAQRIATIKRK